MHKKHILKSYHKSYSI